ncbi:MAG TPA: EF-P lysine aminoacylase GenX [Desulfobacteraceae bacterium]|nr:EF-P lysine aminoacylase GenX [Desulfobacteraceae bacterium]
MTGSALLNNLTTRSLVIQLTRDFFIGNGYLEVETPLRCPAIIPEAHIDPVAAEGQFLQASPELCMKRLLAMGADKIFQICKCFRKEERGDRHLPELTLLEWYGKGHTYLDLMVQCEGLFRHIAEGLGMGEALRFQGKNISLETPFDRLTVAEAFDRYTDTTAEKALSKDRFDEILSFEIEPYLGTDRPCILYDYPAPLASLAKLHPENGRVAQRFELYVAGLELANGFTELTDAGIQKERFEKENRLRSQRGQSRLPLPEKFLTDLKRMPDAAGIALGMDRLVMLFCDTLSIDTVVAFPPEAL